MTNKNRRGTLSGISVLFKHVLEVDNIYQAIKAMTTREMLPAVHYWSTGINWIDIDMSSNVKWLVEVSKEIIPGLKAIVDNHIEADVPVIIEGDFLYPEFTVSFENPKVKSLYVYEPDNYLLSLIESQLLLLSSIIVAILWNTQIQDKLCMSWSFRNFEGCN